MKSIFAKLTGLVLAVSPLVATKVALAACTLNGQEVPCSQVFGGWFLVIWLVLLLVGVALFIFWLWMLIHAITKPIENKPLWIIIILIGSTLGAIIYYFAVKRKFNQSTPVVNQTQ